MMDGGCESGSEGTWSLQLLVGVLATLWRREECSRPIKGHADVERCAIFPRLYGASLTARDRL